MKLNKTLLLIKELNEEGGCLTVYGRDKLDRILNFKAVKSFEWDGDLGGGTIYLKDDTRLGYINCRLM